MKLPKHTRCGGCNARIMLGSSDWQTLPGAGDGRYQETTCPHCTCAVVVATGDERMLAFLDEHYAKWYETQQRVN